MRKTTTHGRCLAAIGACTSLAVALLITSCATSPSRDRAARPAADSLVAKQPDRADQPQRVAAARQAIALKEEKLRVRGAKPMNKPQEAMDFFLQQRLPLDSNELPIQHLLQELDALELREAALVAQRPAGPFTGDVTGWTAIGPGNVGGRTRAIAIDPVNTDVMYAGGVAGGIWKSTDAGTNWTVADDLMLNLAVTCIVIDPTNTSILYAGTGEGFWGSDTFVRGLGIFKSTDAGASWSQLPGTVTGVPAGAFDYVNKLVISPNDHTRLYAATRTGVWRSLDSGDSWDVLISNPRYLSTAANSNGCSVGCTDIAVRTDRNPDVLFAAFGSFEADGLFRSDDGGDSWVAYTVPPQQGRMTLAFAPSNNDVFYLAMADNGLGSGFGRLVNVYRSGDGGDTFTGQVDFDHPFGQWLMSYVTIATGCVEAPVIYSQGWYDNIIAVDPVDPDIVWLGGIDMYRSDNAGVTWGLANYWFYYLLDVPPPEYMHPDQHMIAFHPDYNGTTNQVMYVGNDGGLFRTANARAATTQEECPICPPTEPGCTPGPPPSVAWESMNNGYGVTQYYHGDSARIEDYFAGGSQDNGTSMVNAADTPDDWRLIQGGDGGYVAFNPEDSQTMFIEYQGFPNIWKSTNGGDSFVLSVNGITDTDGTFIAPYALDQRNPDILWTGGSRPWRTTDAAANWEVAGPNLSGPGTITAVAIAPSDSNIVYLGYDNGYVAHTVNALDASPTWATFTNGLIGGWVSSVAIDPVDPDTAYITYSNYNIPHVLQTTNGGSSWQSIDGIDFTGVPDIPAHWIAVRPCDNQQLYVGTELGVFASDDQGATWQPVNSLGLAHTVVETLDFKNENTLVAFTHGRGTFIGNLAPCRECFADVNDSNAVDTDDFLAVIANWGECPSPCPPSCPGDATGDCLVNTDDFLAILANWGPCAAP